MRVVCCNFFFLFCFVVVSLTRVENYYHDTPGPDNKEKTTTTRIEWRLYTRPAKYRDQVMLSSKCQPQERKLVQSFDYPALADNWMNNNKPDKVCVSPSLPPIYILQPWINGRESCVTKHHENCACMICCGAHGGDDKQWRLHPISRKWVSSVIKTSHLLKNSLPLPIASTAFVAS